MGAGRLPPRGLRRLGGLLLGGLLATSAWAQTGQALIHSTRLAGFSHHEAAALWPRLRVGDALELQAEPANPHDARAIRVLWQGRLLGYLPARENAPLAAAMAQGRSFSGRIRSLREHPNPAERIHIDVLMPYKYD